MGLNNVGASICCEMTQEPFVGSMRESEGHYIEYESKRYQVTNDESHPTNSYVNKANHSPQRKYQRYQPYFRNSRSLSKPLSEAANEVKSRAARRLLSQYIIGRGGHESSIVGQLLMENYLTQLELPIHKSLHLHEANTAARTELLQKTSDQGVIQSTARNELKSATDLTDEEGGYIGYAEVCSEPTATKVNADAIFRSDNKRKAQTELSKNLRGANKLPTSATGTGVDVDATKTAAVDASITKTAVDGTAVDGTAVDGTDVDASNTEKAVDKTGVKSTTEQYSTDTLPGATGSHDQHYETDFGENVPISKEETRKNVRAVFKEDDVDSILQSYQKPQITPTAIGNVLQPLVQDKAKPPAKTVPSSSVNKSHRSLPRRACLVHLSEQYRLDHDLLSQPRATKFYVKIRTEISPGRYMAKLELHCSSKDDRLPNLDATQQPDEKAHNEDVVPNRDRKHFPHNISKIGHVIFSSNPECFSGSVQYPLPNKKAVASRIGYGGNAIVFVVFYAGKEFAVKKTVYRSKEISVHSQLSHPNIINLEAVLIGEKHERHKDKHYVYCFMPKMDINFRNVLSTKEHGCLKHMKMQLVEKREQWELVLANTKHVLKSVLKALDYMHSQGLVHRDIKASNILVKMTCQCAEVLYCSCQPRRKFLVQIGDFDSSATVPGYQLQLEEHQMIRYASVLPLGTMGYRAPEVSMHLVLSGPYEVLYTTSVDIWSFGCLLLTIFIGKSGPLKQRGEASLLLSAQDYPYSQDLYLKIIKLKEVQKYYANTPGVCDLVQKCLQVQPHCRPSAKELLQLDFFSESTP